MHERRPRVIAGRPTGRGQTALAYNATSVAKEEKDNV